MFFLFNFFFCLLFILCLVLTVAYYTLAERKIISAMQCRNGPDSVGLFGLLQPISDALKLLFKKCIVPKQSLSIFFLLSPIMVLLLSIITWSVLTITPAGPVFNSEYSLLWVLVFSSLNVYALFLSGFSSSSKFALIGSIRSIVQMISYEIAISILLLPIVLVSSSANLNVIIINQNIHGFSNFMWMLPNSILFLICILAETNRAPFDLPEAEAELVAGYNVEYSSIPFAFFFLGEYLNMIAMSVLFVSLFWSGWGFIIPIPGYNIITTLISTGHLSNITTVSMILKSLIVAFFIIWVRATLPRVRFDVLMNLFWKNILFLSFSFLIFFVSIYVFFFLII